MAFQAFPDQRQVVELLQRSLDRGRLGHAYLFTGADLAELEAMALTLTKTLNCQHPPSRGASGLALDCCDTCLSCRKFGGQNHPDIHWVRPESKLREITVDKMREVMDTIYLKPTEAEFKCLILVAADRLNVQAANAFLKTLEEPPAKSIMILLTTEPQRLLETILSRCLRLSFASRSGVKVDEPTMAWLAGMADEVSGDQRRMLGRYKAVALLLKHLSVLKEEIEARISALSPIEKYPDADPVLVKKWEKELSAAIEAEYRFRRKEVLAAMEWWMRDIWLHTLGVSGDLLSFPTLAEQARKIASRLQDADARGNLLEIERLQRILHTNVQEAIALEVTFLKFKF